MNIRQCENCSVILMKGQHAVKVQERTFCDELCRLEFYEEMAKETMDNNEVDLRKE